MSARIDADLQRAIEAGEAAIDAILSVDNIEEVRDRLPKTLKVRAEFKLLPGMAVTGSASDLLAASRIAGVRRLEPDRDVGTQK